MEKLTVTVLADFFQGVDTRHKKGQKIELDEQDAQLFASSGWVELPAVAKEDKTKTITKDAK